MVRTAAASTTRTTTRTWWKRSDLPSWRLVALTAWHGPGVWEHLTGPMGVPPKVARAAIYRDISRGLLDCGTAVERPWLTDRGRALIDN